MTQGSIDASQIQLQLWVIQWAHEAQQEKASLNQAHAQTSCASTALTMHLTL